ncbi:MAG: bifunctional (p)ppGpp synthetase/guanosine-3',5'-bis(diphosphate) 3'-pyrophosphohydrolase [Candidatus Chaera renei]|uniref:Bifunctional (P)ppGpp synthetase/guanosine-3',5'-bis(Diphosphate) 3'-pyrophosphohydrolase n=1 Tax=Candidatus Chaera renei TaxID=2506947 RepID=A0A4Q0AG15_9BACT|nr:MAG: bifunctional (p)ppGpp synthetase/guanosine-3',5'-bis(diphosphate) 3'-pyrophosphohydrolase [Candidatus Chaera renei]
MQASDLIRRAATHYDSAQLEHLRRAISVAETAHGSQLRLSGEPYISHPLQVADTLMEWGMDIDTILAGVLHDTLEDTQLTLLEIENEFGQHVAFLVDGVTKLSKARSGMRDISSYLPQTRDNLSKLLIAIGRDIRVVIIKLADRLHNMQTLNYLPKEKQLKIARESLEVFAPMADRMGMGRVRMQLEELAFAYIEPQQYAMLKKLMKDRLGKSHKKLVGVRHEVERALQQQSINFAMDGRVKSIYSLHKKLAKVDGQIDNIYDMIALRVIVDSKEDCYQVLGVIHSLYQPMVARIKDYIATPKPNGYQSLHTTVLTQKEQIVEFQIRSKQMHEYAERGLAAGFHYHEQKGSNAYRKGRSSALPLPTKLQWISRLQDVAVRLVRNEEIPIDQLRLELFTDRIFVHSPKGDIYDLPEGAYPLDFAYLVHSDLAQRAHGFKVNGKMVAFDRALQNGDVVEVITRRNAQPKDDWLDLVKTTHAREKLRAQLKKLQEKETV